MKCETGAHPFKVIKLYDGGAEDTLQILNIDVREYNVIDRGNGIVEISNGYQTSYLTDVEVRLLIDQLLLIDDMFDSDADFQMPVIFDPAHHTALTDPETRRLSREISEPAEKSLQQ